MKAINHNKGNYHFVDIYDSSVMYGTIEMTMKEYKEAVKYLKRAYNAMKNSYTKQTLGYTQYPTDKKVFCLGVTATELIFKRYSLPRYKRQNYSIRIV